MIEYEVSLKDVTDQGRQVKSFFFERPNGYDFQAGQYAILKVADNLSKVLSFSNSPTEEGYLRLTTKMSGSEYKNKLDSLKVGDKARISAAMGKFTLKPGVEKIVFLAGGIGITPFLSMSKYVEDKGLGLDIVLVCGNNTAEDTVLSREFFDISSKNPKFKLVDVIANPPPDWRGRRGFITRECIIEEAPDYLERTFYVCGPPKMVEAMNELLAKMGLPKEKIVVEQFSGY